MFAAIAGALTPITAVAVTPKPVITLWRVVMPSRFACSCRRSRRRRRCRFAISLLLPDEPPPSSATLFRAKPESQVTLPRSSATEAPPEPLSGRLELRRQLLDARKPCLDLPLDQVRIPDLVPAQARSGERRRANSLLLETGVEGRHHGPDPSACGGGGIRARSCRSLCVRRLPLRCSGDGRSC